MQVNKVAEIENGEGMWETNISLKGERKKRKVMVDCLSGIGISNNRNGL